jgi:adenylyltransferase/sulfurtransferase
VQVHPGGATGIDFVAIAKKLQPVAAGVVSHNRFMLKAAIDGHELTLFPDGRAIIKGTNDPDRARTLYAKYVGA